MKILITVAVAQRGHVSHPEMIGKCTDQAHSLFEAELDLEAQPIYTNDLDGTQGGIGTHQEASPPGGMNDGHKTDEQPRWTHVGQIEAGLALGAPPAVTVSPYVQSAVYAACFRVLTC